MYHKVIHSLIKDESYILKEWIIHNIENIGFDHIFIYDDQSDKSIELEIQDLPEKIKLKVTIFEIEKNIHFYNKLEFQESFYYDEEIYEIHFNNKQFYFQNLFIKHYNYISNWCFFCDVDELIYLKNNITFDCLLKENEKYDIIYIPWLIYGSSFFIDQPEGLIINNFKYHDFKYHELGKSICKLNKIKNINHAHSLSEENTIFKYNFNQPLYSIPIHINHYQINSLKLYIKRKLRSEIGFNNGSVRDANDIFLFMLSYNNVYNNCMDKYIKNINVILNKEINNIPVNLNYNFASNCLYIDNKLYFKIESYEDLFKIQDSNNVRFLKFEDELPKNFNINRYKIINKDLNDMNDIQLLNHYILFGQKEKRNYIKEPEIKKEIILETRKEILSSSDESSEDLSSEDEKTTISKKETSDMEEDDFSNPDDSSSDLDDLEEEDINNSLLPLDFDVLVYKTINKDLSNLSNINAIYHYINNGINENRKYKLNTLPEDFEAEMYKKLNKDLKEMTNDEVTNHYLMFGIDEKRKYKKNNILKEKKDLPPDDFDAEMYKKLNKDLRHLTNEEASNHYLINGINEKRKYKKNKEIDSNNFPSEEITPPISNITYSSILPEDFSVETYKLLNKDLQHFSNSEAITHYINFGIKEKRKYINNVTLPEDFDPIMYKKLNKDLQFFSDKEATNHYLIYGKEEKRKYKKKSS